MREIVSGIAWAAVRVKVAGSKLVLLPGRS